MIIPNDILHWLACVRLNGIGPTTIRRGLAYFQKIENIFSASHHALLTAGFKENQILSIKNPNWKLAESDLQWSEQHHADILTLEHMNYPSLLREIHDAPLLLFTQGNSDILSKPQIAIVGSRNPTLMGKENAEYFGGALTQKGMVITSGMALGIDAAAHRGAIKSGGETIAVLGTGLNNIYPYSHRKLREEILEKGVIISEFPPDEKPKPKNFPRRNRIISGLSLGVLVIEAALKSGSLITARFALEQGREIFAMPGSIHNPLVKGCHQLLKEGAKLVECVEDILSEFKHLAIKDGACIDEKSRKILQNIGYEVTPLDVIIRHFGLTTSEVSSILLYLELQGYIQNVPGGYVRIRQ